jgi:hypothetical protein
VEIFASQGALSVSTTPVEKFATSINDTSGKFCHRYQRHQRQILPPEPLVLLIPVANLPPLLMACSSV